MTCPGIIRQRIGSSPYTAQKIPGGIKASQGKTMSYMVHTHSHLHVHVPINGLSNQLRLLSDDKLL